MIEEEKDLVNEASNIIARRVVKIEILTRLAIILVMNMDFLFSLRI